MPSESRRTRAIQSPIIPVVADLIRRHPGTVSLGQGVVGYGPPPESIAQIERFHASPANHKYQAVEGIPELVEAIKAKLAAENGLRVDSGSRVVVTAGGNMAFVNALLAVADPGDEVILQTPYYFNHEMAVVMAGCRAVLVPTDANYQLQPELIRAARTARTRAVVTVSPNNPTGAVYSESSLREVNRWCGEQGLYHVHDEAYEYFTYDGAAHFSPGSIQGSENHTFTLCSLSKSYGFASWRIGWMVIPAHLEVAVRKLQDTILICPPVISQFAALGALQAGRRYVEPRLRELRAVRSAVQSRLAGVDGCVVPSVSGAFYFLIRVGTSLTAMDVVERLVRDHRVAVIPGNAFGLEQGCHLRVAYAALPGSEILEGVDRLARGLAALPK